MSSPGGFFGSNSREEREGKYKVRGQEDESILRPSSSKPSSSASGRGGEYQPSSSRRRQSPYDLSAGARSGETKSLNDFDPYDETEGDGEADESDEEENELEENVSGDGEMCEKPPKKKRRVRDIKDCLMPFFKRFWPTLGQDNTSSNVNEGRMNSQLLGRPVEEVDPFIFEETFCVISSKFGKHYVNRFSATNSLFLFTPLSRIRKFAVAIVTNQYFDICIILTIFANCILLASDHYKEQEPLGSGIVEEISKDLDVTNPKSLVELIFLIIYTLEMVVKILAKGFIFNKFSYLRNRWNILDFVCVVAGYITLIIQHTHKENTLSFDLDILRTFRVLRAVKTISILPGLRMMINALLSSIVQLIEVMALTLFCLMIFALVALEIFMGKLRQKCLRDKGGIEDIGNDIIRDDDPNRHYLYNKWAQDSDNWLKRSFPGEEFVPCGNGSFLTRNCPEGYTCIKDLGDNPDEGWTSFDDFFRSTLTTFQLITLDYWERPYELVVATSGGLSVIYFLMVVFLGSFYLLNLMLAVVSMSYETEAQNADLGPMSKHQKLSLHRTDSTFSFDEPTKLNVTVMTHYRKRTPSEREMIAKSLRNASLGKRKPRRAIRRKPPKSAERRGGLGADLGSEFGAGSTVVSTSGSPILKSGTGSICEESMNGGSEDPQRQPEVFLGESGGGAASSVIVGGAVVVLRRKRGTKGGGQRVCGRVRALSESEENRFYLETEKNGTSKAGAAGEDTAVQQGKGKMKNGDPSDDIEYSDEEETNVKPSLTVPMPIVPIISETAPSPDNDPYILTNIPGQEKRRASKYNQLKGIKINEDDLYEINDLKMQISNYLKKCKTRLKPVVNHWLFDAFITACIALNTILLAMEHHEAPEILERIGQYGNYTFTVIFTLEFFFKLLALQRDFFKSNWNLFDLFIVIASWIDIVIDLLEQTNTSTAFGSIRLLRVFKLAQSWITMKVLLNIIFSTFGALGNLTLVLLIVIYIFAVLGMQLVGKGYTHKAFCGGRCEGVSEDDFPSWRFEHFGYAFMMVFRVLCGEWIEPMWECLKAQKDDGEIGKPDGQWKCFVIFIAITIVGNFIILNLFLALLLNSFNTEELNAQRDKEMEASGKSANLKKIVGLLLKAPKEPGDEVDEDGQPKDAQNKSKSNSPLQVPRIQSCPPTPSENSADISDLDPSDSQYYIDVQEGEPNPTLQGKKKFKKLAMKVIMNNRKTVAEAAIQRMENSEKRSLRPYSRNSMERRDSTMGVQFDAQANQPKVQKTPNPCFPKRCWDWNILGFSDVVDACCCWTAWEGLRKFCLRIVSHSFFEWFILFLIFASSITLCFEDIYLEERAELQIILFYLNSFFTAVFIVEMVLKLFAMGVWTYFTDIWCILDAFIVIVSCVTFYFDIESKITSTNPASKKGFGALKALRTLRAFRPLRAISRWQGMKIVVNALMYAIPAIFNVLLVCLLFWLIFSIMGVQLFKGKFYRCIDNESGDNVPYRNDFEESDGIKVHDKMECCQLAAEGKPYSWVNFVPNYDNVFEAYLSLFQIATFEGWMEIMKLSVDFGDVDQHHKSDRNLWYHLYYVIFIVLGSFFTLNLFIGVIIDNFNMLKKKYEGNLLEIFLTPSQRHYYTAMKKLGRKKPRKVIRRPTNSFLSIFYDISMSRRFEIAIFFMIFLNMVVMGFEHYNQQMIVKHVLQGFNSFFTTIYALEAIVKIVGLRHYYFTVPWNLFDLTLVVISVVELFVDDTEDFGIIDPAIIRVVRVFRIGRVLRLIKAAKGIRKLLFALIVSLPALFNIGALLALLTFIYAILGMSFFGKAPKFDTYDDLFNFETFVKSCLVLLRLMTSAGWNEVYDALMQSPPPICGTYRKLRCDGEGEPECINRLLLTVYMVTYIIICWHIVINMYIAVILENFVEANKEEEIGIVEDDLEMFYVRWSRYDPQATQFISFDQLSEFLGSLDPPLCIPKPNIVAIVAFNLPIARGNKIHCLDILHALVKHVLGHIDESEEFRKLQEQMEQKFRKQFPTRKLLDIISSTRIWKVQQNAAIVIQRAWRAYRARKYPPTDSVKATQTVQQGLHQPQSGFMNRMGNLLHIGVDKPGKRRDSIAIQLGGIQGTGVVKGIRLEEGRGSESSTTSQSSPMSKLECSMPRLRSGNCGRRLSPSRMSGGSFDVAVTYGNQLSVQMKKNVKYPTNGPSPLPSCPTTPSSISEEPQSIVQVQLHHLS